MNECERELCENGGVCVNTFGSFYCNCTPGFVGSACSVRPVLVPDMQAGHAYVGKEELIGIAVVLFLILTLILLFVAFRKKVFQKSYSRNNLSMVSGSGYGRPAAQSQRWALSTATLCHRRANQLIHGRKSVRSASGSRPADGVHAVFSRRRSGNLGETAWGRPRPWADRNEHVPSVGVATDSGRDHSEGRGRVQRGTEFATRFAVPVWLWFPTEESLGRGGWERDLYWCLCAYQSMWADSGYLNYSVFCNHSTPNPLQDFHFSRRFWSIAEFPPS